MSDQVRRTSLVKEIPRNEEPRQKKRNFLTSRCTTRRGRFGVGINLQYETERADENYRFEVSSSSNRQSGGFESEKSWTFSCGQRKLQERREVRRRRRRNRGRMQAKLQAKLASKMEDESWNGTEEGCARKGQPSRGYFDRSAPVLEPKSSSHTPSPPIS